VEGFSSGCWSWTRRANNKVCAVGQDEVCGGGWCHCSPSAPPCGKAFDQNVKSRVLDVTTHAEINSWHTLCYLRTEGLLPRAQIKCLHGHGHTHTYLHTTLPCAMRYIDDCRSPCQALVEAVIS
jgi:hypothetical protein